MFNKDETKEKTVELAELNKELDKGREELKFISKKKAANNNLQADTERLEKEHNNIVGLVRAQNEILDEKNKETNKLDEEIEVKKEKSQELTDDIKSKSEVLEDIMVKIGENVKKEEVLIENMKVLKEDIEENTLKNDGLEKILDRKREILEELKK